MFDVGRSMLDVSHKSYLSYRPHKTYSLSVYSAYFHPGSCRGCGLFTVPSKQPSRLIRLMFPTRLPPVLRYSSNQSTLTGPNPRQPLHKRMQHGRARLQWPPVQPSSPDSFRQGPTIAKPTTAETRRSISLSSSESWRRGPGRGGTKPPFPSLGSRTSTPAFPLGNYFKEQ